jgi:hypothetical protein
VKGSFSWFFREISDDFNTTLKTSPSEEVLEVIHDFDDTLLCCLLTLLLKQRVAALGKLQTQYEQLQRASTKLAQSLLACSESHSRLSETLDKHAKSLKAESALSQSDQQQADALVEKCALLLETHTKTHSSLGTASKQMSTVCVDFASACSSFKNVILDDVKQTVIAFKKNRALLDVVLKELSVTETVERLEERNR